MTLLMQDERTKQKRHVPYNRPRGWVHDVLLGSAGPLLALHLGTATRRPAATLEAGAAMWRLVRATTAGAVAEGRTAVTGRAAACAEGKAILTLITAVAKVEHLLTVIVLGVAPDAPAVFSEHPHVEGHVAVVFEVEGAPPS